ncbi:sigma-54 interaction domain-containing protein [Derxia gummosa]|uniref:Sigma-54 interaction domain-containing protein n=1 Tax=Derxia gummosa DSM 723 TaxID=1121388 RepID=A0A8B6X9D0_9BURK|nr:sigma 54-interacting transcriptional regulator [Derxia gummosa]
MPDSAHTLASQVLTLPDSPGGVLSIRAKALLFHDPRSADLLEHVERIARSDATVLVIGETGTGKELIARHIHNRSGRKGPFLAVNCGAFSESLIDAELFGHESGAFTGASQARAGWFESANGGTLFLDEIGDLPMPLQVKLLRVLQERQVVRLGSRRSIPLDVRLVAATNIDLIRAVEAQHFRADLYYRLSVASVNLPPLRDRPGDILPLARHFISNYGMRLGAHDVVLSQEAEHALLAYSWPGNIRELENVIHFALIVCRHEVIRAGDLKLVAGVAPGGTGLPPAPAPVPAATVPAHAAPLGRLPSGEPSANDPVESPAWRRLLGSLDALLQEGGPQIFKGVEEALVRAAFAHVGENQVQAARVLGITRNTLRTLLKRYGLIGDGSAESGEGAEPALDAEDELLLDGGAALVR